MAISCPLAAVLSFAPLGAADLEAAGANTMGLGPDSQPFDEGRPLYPVGVTSELLGIHPRTLRLYEQKGLLQPARRSGRRYYSNNEVRWAQCIIEFNHQRGISLEGIRRLLDFLPCWAIRNRAFTRPAHSAGDLQGGLDLLRRACAGEAAPECLGCGNYLRAMGKERVEITTRVRWKEGRRRMAGERRAGEGKARDMGAVPAGGAGGHGWPPGRAGS